MATIARANVTSHTPSNVKATSRSSPADATPPLPVPGGSGAEALPVVLAAGGVADASNLAVGVVSVVPAVAVGVAVGGEVGAGAVVVGGVGVEGAVTTVSTGMTASRTLSASSSGAMYVTELSVEVDAVVAPPSEIAVAAPAGSDTTTPPDPATPVTASVYAAPLPDTSACSVPGAVLPVKATSDPVRPLTGSLKTTAKTIGTVLVGSA
jgi:hypothetical protein